MKVFPTVRWLTLLLSFSLLAGCSTISGWFEFDDDEDPYQPAELLDFEPSIKIKKQWSRGVGDGQGKGFYQLRPVLDGNTLYAASADGDVVALNADNGKELWDQEFDQGLSGGVGLYNNTLLLGTPDAEVIALDTADGSERWRATLHGEVMAPPQSDGRVVAVQTYDGKLHGLDFNTGEVLWSYDSNMPALTVRGTSTPIVLNGMIFAGFSNGRVMGLEASTGAVRWEVRVALPEGRSEIERIVDVDGTMQLVGTLLFAVSYQGNLVGIDVTSGRKVWQQEASSTAGVSQGFGNIYIAEENGTVSAYQRSDQGLRWAYSDLAYRKLSRPTPVSSYVAVGDFEGYVHFISQVDGELVGRVKVDGDGVRSDMIGDGNRLYVYGDGGKLVALEVSAQD